MPENDQEKSVFDIDVGEMRCAWNRTFFSKRITIAGPAALAVGIPIVALGAPAIVGAIAGMYAGMEVSRRVFKRKRSLKQLR